MAERYSEQWRSIEQVVESMPLQVKASDQAGIQGRPIFDAVGTNSYLKREFTKLDWNSNIGIPEEYKFLGTDVDFASGGVIVEVQFANYPFLLNNLLRSELFYKSQTLFADHPTKLLIIIVKARMFPASQSTLYFEQAERQIAALVEGDVIEIPLRLVGLFEEVNSTTQAMWNNYENPRYSRSLVKQELRSLRILAGRRSESRCVLEFIS